MTASPDSTNDPTDAAKPKTSKKKSSKTTTSKKKTATSKKKTVSKKAGSKKSPSKKSGSKKTASKKTSSKKTGAKKAGSKKKAPAKSAKPAAETGGKSSAPDAAEAAAKTSNEPAADQPRPARAVPDLKARARERSSRNGVARAEADPAADHSSDATGSSPEASSETSSKPSSKSAPDRSGGGPTAPGKWEEIFAGKSFADIGLRSSIRRALARLGFKSPTKIQAEMIPIVLAGKDVLGQSRTGSGKTAAFGLPVINGCRRGTAFQCVILAPTRELAIQITEELRSFCTHTPLKIATVYGGQKIHTQAERLAKEPEIIVATPGRLMDMVDRGYVHLRNVRFAVLDEVDRMLDIGFRDDIKKILGKMPQARQTVFVSATISPEIDQLARTFMHEDAERIETTGGSLTVSLVQQQYVSVQPWDKSRMLAHIIRREDPELALVFCRMKRTVDKITGRLRDRKVNAAAIHGDLPQGKRNRIMQELRSGKLHVLVASDLAARGIDVEGITHVINFDLPEDPEIYVHRIGRTARAGRGGKAISLVTPEQGDLLTSVELLANTHIEPITYDDFEPGPEPDDIRQQRRLKQERVERLREKHQKVGPQLPAAKADTVDASKFPGGVVPAKLPPRRIGGRQSGRR